MARGSNPNSRANLTKGKGFCTETARKAQGKSVVSHRANSRLKNIYTEALTDDVLEEIIKAMIKKAIGGNVAAFKALFDVMGEGSKKQTDENTVGIIFLASVLPPEKSPFDKAGTDELNN